MQWALSSNEMDMAIICKDAAEKYVQTEKNFEIVGTVVKNSDVFLLSDENPNVMGTVQNRKYQDELVKEYYPNAKVKHLLANALPYSIESNKVDGGVMDVIKSLSIEGNKKSCATNKDFDTYVLVVNKEFKKTDNYEIFKKLYNKSVDDISDKNKLKKAIENYKNIKLEKKDMGVIENCKLEFLKIN